MLKYEHLVDDIQEVLAKLALKEIEVKPVDEQWYLLRIVPYHTLDNFIGGAVLSFRDVTNVKTLQAQWQATHKFAKDILDAMGESALVLDSHCQIVSANRAFQENFHLDEEQIRGHPIYNLGNGKWNIPELRQLLEANLPVSTIGKLIR